MVTRTDAVLVERDVSQVSAISSPSRAPVANKEDAMDRDVLRISKLRTRPAVRGLEPSRAGKHGPSLRVTAKSVDQTLVLLRSRRCPVVNSGSDDLLVRDHRGRVQVR